MTAELERRWEMTRRELESAEEEPDRLRQEAPSSIIPENVLEMLREGGLLLPEMLNANLLSDAQKKALLRVLNRRPSDDVHG